jgi:hypothetical protein
MAPIFEELFEQLHGFPIEEPFTPSTHGDVALSGVQILLSNSLTKLIVDWSVALDHTTVFFPGEPVLFCPHDPADVPEGQLCCSAKRVDLTRVREEFGLVMEQVSAARYATFYTGSFPWKAALLGSVSGQLLQAVLGGAPDGN